MARKTNTVLYVGEGYKYRQNNWDKKVKLEHKDQEIEIVILMDL